jgi:UDP-glucose 4-epimerase
LRIAVTGGAGFIGANLCRELVSRHAVGRVVALDDLSTGSAANLDGVAVDLVNGSVLDRSALRHVVDGADLVVHLAALPSIARSVADPLASHEANTTGTVYVLEECRRADVPVMVASSSSVYGPTPELPKHEDLPTRPQSPYAASKLAAEGYVLAYGAAYRMRTLALRLFNVYGPLQSADHAYAAVIPAFVDAALRGEPLRVHGDGRQTRDFTFVGSVVRVLADAAVRGVWSADPVNVAFGTRISILDLIAKLERVVGRPVSVEHGPPRTGDVRDSQASDRRLRVLFPDLEPVPIEVGLSATVDWFRSVRSASPSALGR